MNELQDEFLVIFLLQTELFSVMPPGSPASVRVESPIVVFLVAVVHTDPGAVEADVLQVGEAPDINDDLTPEPAIASCGQINLLQALTLYDISFDAN